MAIDSHADTIGKKMALFLIGFIRRRRLETLRKWGRRLGRVAYWCLGSARRTALSNLELAYGSELSADRRVEIAKNSFINLLQTILESCYAPRFAPPMSDHIQVLGVEHLKTAHEQGKGIIFLVPHMGNWEISARYLVEQIPVAHAVSRRQKPAWLHGIIQETRHGNGIREIDNQGSLHACLAALRRGELVIMLVDQYIARGSVPVQFFGRQAMTSAAPALLATRTGCAVLVGACYRLPDGGFGGTFSPIIETTTCGDRDQDLINNTQRYVSVIEEFVRCHPEQWMWMHDRWKPPRRRRKRRHRK